MQIPLTTFSFKTFVHTEKATVHQLTALTLSGRWFERLATAKRAKEQATTHNRNAHLPKCTLHFELRKLGNNLLVVCEVDNLGLLALPCMAAWLSERVRTSQVHCAKHNPRCLHEMQRHAPTRALLVLRPSKTCFPIWQMQIATSTASARMESHSSRLLATTGKGHFRNGYASDTPELSPEYQRHDSPTHSKITEQRTFFIL
jgi:hypothetical protein